MAKNKEYDMKEVVEILHKSIYKAILKSFRGKQQKDRLKDVVDDIADPNYIAEVSPHKIPPKRDKVLYKGCGLKKEANEKGVKKLKSFLNKKVKKG